MDAKGARQRNGNNGRSKRKGRNSNKPLHKESADGKPLILNRKGAYVLDQKKVREQSKKTKQEQLAQALIQIETGPGTTASTLTSAPTFASQANTSSSSSTAKADQIRAAIDKYYS